MIATVLIPLYAAADRIWGMERSEKLKKFPLKAVIAAILMGVGYLIGGFSALGMGAAWLIYRSPGWKVFGGSMDPQNAKQALGLFLRHLIAVPCMALPAYWGGLDWKIAIFAGAAFAVGATILGVILGQIVKKLRKEGKPLGNQNTYIEIARGALYGAALFAVLHFSAQG